MARIIGGIGTSHVPTIGLAYDRKRQDDPAWAPLFEGYKPVARWLAEKQPDVLLFFYNDHANSFFFDCYPTFALGISPDFDMADEGAGRRPLPGIKGHPALAAHVAESLVNDEFDIAVFQERALDHGCNSPLGLMWPHEPGWPGAILPLAINVLQYPLPTAARCYKLGQAVRRAVESFPADLKVVVVGTGGLSHQIHGERTGFNNVEWDEQFLDMIVDQPHKLAALRHAELVELGGAESAEVIMWLAMRGALNDEIRCVHKNHYLATTTNMAVAIYEQGADRQAPAAPVHVNPQVAGMEKIPGTYPFDLRASVHAVRLNRFFWRHREPAFRELVARDLEAAFDELQLSSEERDLVRRRDWLGLVRYGVSFFVLEKFARVVKMSNLAVYAAMRGETLEEFLKTRRVPESA
ncbi:MULTISPECIES: gallate dioxygenase [unclassified Herbaspirillum]|uniref:gallate dioxygenase n=1 Tax=unclassified Herbaspirillum TaxID=2624150 RepID=UPI001150AF78|nr:MULTISPECIES: gallate dioxygenase [unclassified Herbaspirillum]MBB5393785.1 gallate dioxygenase [Herbaspirillum sp. SJZ102]TQK01355.1 protocatechuate 4,5-dioxygenase alpha subunit /protocatechuate 4,5-dioxygenase beta subunit [Herbaspirillum sp. SJZ130]TQK05751.1 protocatechuate 4,5-dioxygenase alpha subunit /protocatechuate 4,5-dioxygenase beta subunit [Herbaspirillum sp. SJZ106]TWC65123.1 protocatechuate 4,5-dioxygenase alpha subunit /protocatechuate 4,5-dioxygenase beta subunit [Herbaspir